MATDPVRLPYERDLPELLHAYRDAQRILVRDLRAALADAIFDPVAEARARRLQTQLFAALRVIEDLGHQTDPLARRLVARAFTESAAHTQGQLSLLGVPEFGGAGTPVGTFAGVSAEAVRALEDSMVGRLDEARRVVGRRVADVYQAAGRRATMLALTGATGSRRDTSRELARSLSDDGVKGFVDRAGRTWALDTYAEMVARTTTREAVVEGAINRMLGHGVKVARVSRHASACKICKPWEGKLVSLDGSTMTLRGEAVATLGAMPHGGPPFHPNCRHTLTPVAEGIGQLRAELAGIV